MVVTRLALLLALIAFALPASAADRMFMRESLRFAWAPASGPVAGYDLLYHRPDGAVQAFPVGNVTSVQADRLPGVQWRLSVRAYDADGVRGPASDLTPDSYKLFPGVDVDGSGIIEARDISNTASLFMLYVCADGELKPAC